MGVLRYQREVKKDPKEVVRKEKIEKRNQGLEGLNEMQRIMYRPVGACIISNETRAKILASVSELKKTESWKIRRMVKDFIGLNVSQ